MTRRRLLAGVAAVTLTPFLLRSLSACHTDLPPEVTDAVTHRTYDAVRGWVNWLAANGTKGYFGETSWPNNLEGSRFYKEGPRRGQSDIPQWEALGEKVYDWFDWYGIWATSWVAAHTTNANHLRMYGTTQNDKPLSERTINVAYRQAVNVVEGHPSASGVLRGTSANGGELYRDGFSNQNPGTYGSHYVYPDEADFRYLAGRGHKIARVPFRWERIQPQIGESLSTQEVSRLRSSLRGAAAAGMRVIIDVHNYAGYHFSDGNFRIGTARLPLWTFEDLWSRLSAAFKGQPSVLAYDIMNEPQDMLGGVPQWEDASRRAVAAIRQNGDGKLVMVPGYQKDSYNRNGVFAFTRNHPEAWVADTNIMYTTHGYWGRYNYRYTYDEDNAYWSSRGY
jgi:aryl-phospho-beta-D-glucosidase BglC (GH1 family)